MRTKGSWKCNNDEHFNNILDVVCEICGEKRPIINTLKYELTDKFGKVKIIWDVDNFENGTILKNKIKHNIFNRKGSLDIDGLNHKDKITFLVDNQIATFSETLQINLEKPIISVFNTNEEELLENSETQLNWDVKNAESVFITNIGKVNTKGHLEKKVENSHYKIIAKNAIGTVEQSLNLKILPPPKINYFKPDNFKIIRGEYAELTWDVENTTAIELTYKGKRTKVPSTGKIKVKPNNHLTYTLELTALDGKTKSKHTAKVEVYDKGAIKKFTIDRQFILPSIPVTLSWEVEHAKNVTLEGFGEFQLIDSIEVRPENDTLYKLIVEDEFGVFEEFTQVRILPLPVLETLIIPTPDLHSSLDIKINSPKFPKLNNSFDQNFPSIYLSYPEFKVQYAQIDTSNFVRLPDSVHKFSNKFNFDKIIDRFYEIINKFSISKKHNTIN